MINSFLKFSGEFKKIYEKSDLRTTQQLLIFKKF